jgi:hypothetical protein
MNLTQVKDSVLVGQDKIVELYFSGDNSVRNISHALLPPSCLHRRTKRVERIRDVYWGARE